MSGELEGALLAVDKRSAFKRCLQSDEMIGGAVSSLERLLRGSRRQTWFVFVHGHKARLGGTRSTLV